MRFTRPLVLALAILAFAGRASAGFTVADNYRPLRYSATANQTAFSVTWPFEADADLKVYLSEDGGTEWFLQTLDTVYTVSGESTTNGGVVTFADPLSSGDLVIILRNDSTDRTSDFTTLTPDAVNLHLDRLAMQLQQLEDIVENRCLQLPKENDYSGSGITSVLPSIVGKGGYHLRVKSGGTGVEWVAP